MAQPRILIVEDEAIVARDIREQLSRLGYDPVGDTPRGALAFEAVERERPDLVLMDVQLEGVLDGVSVAQGIRDRFAIPVVFLTAFSDDATLDRAKLAAPYGYLTKPFAERDLRRTIELALTMHRFSRKLEDSERDARAGHARLEAILDATVDAIITFDADRRIVMVNGAASRLFGYPLAELIGMNVIMLMSEPDWSRYSGYLADYERTGERQVIGSMHEVVGRRRDGSEVPLELSVSVLPLEASAGRYLATMRDITLRRQVVAEREQLEARYLQSQRMEALGRLAGGVSHDFNNLLTVIIGRAEQMLAELADDAHLRVPLAQIISVADRAAHLTRQLLAFSRKQVLKRQAVDLVPLVGRMKGLLDHVIGEDIELVVTAPSRLACVMGDAGQIEQVIMNLAINARDAMPDGGTLVIELHDATVDLALAAACPPLQPGPHVEMIVRDSGSGIESEIMARIFEPFFTTKGPGLGTGLGLSTVHGIVYQSGGSILVRSVLGYGTTFTIYLPVADAPEEQLLPRLAAAPSRGSETVLLVEDERAIRELVGEILTSAGYTVRTAANGGEALTLLARHPEAVHLMLSDVVMPELSGPALAGRLASVRPDMRVLFMSGYADGDFSRHGLEAGNYQVLNKPFSVDELRHAVRAVLDSPDGHCR